MKCVSKKKIKLIIILGVVMITLVGCYKAREKEYYSVKSNFVSITSEITYIKYNLEYSALYISVSEVPEGFSDVTFKITDLNWELIKERGGEQVLKVGKEITFSTAPRYFGDGYVMPIVALLCDGIEYLEFDEGYTNFMMQY